MRIQYETKIEDLQEWRRQLLSQPEIRGHLRRQRIMGGVLVAIPVFVMLTTSGLNPFQGALWAGAAFIGSVLLRRALEIRQWALHLRNLRANSDGMSILGKNALEITDELVSESGALRSYAVHWELVKRIMVRPRHVMFVLKNYQGIIVPLESIDPRSDREAFLESLERCAPVDLREEFSVGRAGD
jgi:hypothetical protein